MQCRAGMEGLVIQRSREVGGPEPSAPPRPSVQEMSDGGLTQGKESSAKVDRKWEPFKFPGQKGRWNGGNCY